MARMLGAEGRAGDAGGAGDIPHVTAAEIAAVMEAHRPRRRSPSFPRMTNGFERGALSPPLVMPLQFGDDSFLPHLETARGVGYRTEDGKILGIGLVMDQPADLRVFNSRAAHGDTGHKGLETLATSTPT